MTRLLTLSILITAEMPETAHGCAMSASEIVKRIDEIDPGCPMYEQAHARLDALITRRDELLTR